MILAKRFYWFVRFFLRYGGWLGLMILMLGFWATFLSIRLQDEAEQLAKYAVTTPATVISKRLSEGTGAGVRNNSLKISYYITIRYTPKGSATIEDEDQVRDNIYRAAEIGQTINIRHLPDNPQVREYYAGEKARKQTEIQVGGAGLAIFGLFTCLWFCVPALRATRARENVGITIETYVTLRRRWPPFFNSMEFQVGQGSKAKFHNTVKQLSWAYRGLKRGSKIRVAITPYGPYWVKDLKLK